MSVFRWTAPVFKLASRRWSVDDFCRYASLLRAYVPSGGRLIDLAGGTGDLGAGVAACLDARVLIADATGQMLARVDPHPSVSVSLTTADRLPFPDASFDALICSDAFHHFPDQDAVTDEIARVVRPGGGVLILDFEPIGVMRVAAVLERLVGEPATFLGAEDLQKLLHRKDIHGGFTRQSRISYTFLGVRG